MTAIHKFYVLPDLICALVSILGATFLFWELLRLGWFRGSLLRRSALTACWIAASLVFLLTWLFCFARVSFAFPPRMVEWTQAFGLIGGFCVTCAAVLVALLRRVPRPFREDRRDLFRAAGAMALVTPPVVAAFGIIDRTQFRVTETKLAVPNLPRDLQGLRMVQVTDVHLSPFLSEKEMARAVDMANETRAHVAFMTGDLITRPGDPLDACIRQIARLRADAGVYGCLGNHEIYCGTEAYVTRECARRGIRFLRSEATDLRFGAATIHLAGVDYQPMHSVYLQGAESLVAPDKFNLLLSHNPDVFRVAAHQGWNVVLSGHTHGGQVNVEILRQNLNVARFFTPWVRGPYHLGSSAIYVSSGIGTIGMPMRLGAPPEISVVQLCAI